MIYVYGLFRPSFKLELGINTLEKEGFKGDKLTVVTLYPGQPGKPRLLDTMYSFDGMGLLDGVAISALVGMVLGTIYGSVVFIGPVAMGLLGMAVGGGLGFLLDRLIRLKKRPGYDIPAGEIIVAVCCKNEQMAARAESIMLDYGATATGRG